MVVLILVDGIVVLILVAIEAHVALVAGSKIMDSTIMLWTMIAPMLM